MAQRRFTHVRIGDTERDEAVALLAQHFSAGRLSPAEHELRHIAAKAAVLRSEIELLFDDLPAPHPDLSAAEPPRLTAEQKAALEASRETPVSKAMTVAGGLVVLVGVPGGFVLGFTLGWWWSFGVVFALMLVALVLSEVTKKRKIQD
jgi:Flp pilus assembly protein TadB